jgi:hypothetical protein
VPKKVSNILWSLFRGIQGMMEHLEWKIDLSIRERNLLTATHKSSLITLASQNGFEPALKIPAQGLLYLEISQRTYNKYGYPLFVPPYAVFICKGNSLKYYFNSDAPLTLLKNTYRIPVIEGEVINIQKNGTGDYVQRIYLTDATIANNSISVSVNNIQFVQVKSFYDNYHLNNNKQYTVKFSSNIQTPIVIYIKGVELNDTIDITYRTTYGELGNLTTTETFETSDIITQSGEEASLTKDDITITNIYGFNYGSEGTDENSLRSAIGFNHGNVLLFDNNSYRNFINRFSTLLLQTIEVDPDLRQKNDIYVGKKQILSYDTPYIIIEYPQVIRYGNYILSESEKTELSNLLSEQEYCLSSHTINDIRTVKYALQISYRSIAEKDYHSTKLSQLLYSEFSKFLYDRFYRINIDALFESYKKEYNLIFDYYVFQDTPATTAHNQHNCYAYGDITHDTHLPILCGDFDILTDTSSTITLFNDINHIVSI